MNNNIIDSATSALHSLTSFESGKVADVHHNRSNRLGADADFRTPGFYEIKKLNLISYDKNNSSIERDIIPWVGYVAIAADISSPMVTVTLKVFDNVALADELKLDGREMLDIEIRNVVFSKNANAPSENTPPKSLSLHGDLDEKFTKMTLVLHSYPDFKRSQNENTTQEYTMVFTSPIHGHSKTQMISQSAKGPVDKIISDLFKQYLPGCTKFNFNGPTSPPDKIQCVIPWQTPLKAIEWLRTKAISMTGSKFVIFGNTQNLEVDMVAISDLIDPTNNPYVTQNTPIPTYTIHKSIDDIKGTAINKFNLESELIGITAAPELNEVQRVVGTAEGGGMTMHTIDYAMRLVDTTVQDGDSNLEYIAKAQYVPDPASVQTEPLKTVNITKSNQLFLHLPISLFGISPGVYEGGSAGGGYSDASAGDYGDLPEMAPDWKKLILKYETSGRGSSFISSGKGDRGGQSYGTYQFTYDPENQGGSVMNFVRKSGYASEFAGLKPTTSAFNAKWKELARRDPAGFKAAEDRVFRETDLNRTMKRAEARGINLQNPGIQAMMASLTAQHGSGGAIAYIIKPAMRRNNISSFKGMSDADVIKMIYAERAREGDNGKLAHFQGSDLDFNRGIRNRFKNEVRDALAICNQASGGAPADTGDSAVAENNALPQASDPVMGGENSVAMPPPTQIAPAISSTEFKSIPRLACDAMLKQSYASAELETSGYSAAFIGDLGLSPGRLLKLDVNKPSISNAQLQQKDEALCGLYLISSIVHEFNNGVFVSRARLVKPKPINSPNLVGGDIYMDRPTPNAAPLGGAGGNVPLYNMNPNGNGFDMNSMA